MAGNIKSCVVDASFVLTYLFPLEKTKKVDEIFEKCKNGEIRLLSTTLLPFEVLNGVRWAIVKKRISENEAEKMVNAFLNFDIEYERISFEKTFKLALKQELTVYDAAYLSLALKKKIPLLTFDKELKKLTKKRLS